MVASTLRGAMSWKASQSWDTGSYRSLAFLLLLAARARDFKIFELRIVLEGYGRPWKARLESHPSDQNETELREAIKQGMEVHTCSSNIH